MKCRIFLNSYWRVETGMNKTANNKNFWKCITEKVQHLIIKIASKEGKVEN